jgi:hypothetical protein
MASIKSMEFDENDELEFVTVRMSAEEAAFIAKFTGRQTGETAEKIMSGGAPASSHLYEAMTGLVFNRLYDGGVDDWHQNHF